MQLNVSINDISKLFLIGSPEMLWGLGNSVFIILIKLVSSVVKKNWALRSALQSLPKMQSSCFLALLYLHPPHSSFTSIWLSCRQHDLFPIIKLVLSSLFIIMWSLLKQMIILSYWVSGWKLYKIDNFMSTGTPMSWEAAAVDEFSLTGINVICWLALFFSG